MKRVVFTKLSFQLSREAGLAEGKSESACALHFFAQYIPVYKYLSQMQLPQHRVAFVFSFISHLTHLFSLLSLYHISRLCLSFISHLPHCLSVSLTHVSRLCCSYNEPHEPDANRRKTRPRPTHKTPTSKKKVSKTLTATPLSTACLKTTWKTNWCHGLITFCV